jgi:hypothetical protein
MSKKQRKERHDDHPDQPVNVIDNKDSARRSKETLESKGQDERGRYAKTHPDPVTPDNYKAKR